MIPHIARPFGQTFTLLIHCLSIVFLMLPNGTPLSAQELPDGTDAAVKQLATFRVPEGMKVELFAAEPQLASPVAIGLDERNRVFVAEEYRFNLGTEENRTRPFLLEDDLQLQTTADRLRMYEKWAAEFEGGMDWFTKVSDQIRMVEDHDGDGQADRSTVFAPGFNAPLDGLAAGVMATDGDVYFTCIPNLWRLRDIDNDGIADERTVIQSGFGVNAGFLGHDLHGLCWGPDGKLYFSVGDRGFHLKTQEGLTLHGPRSGAVFRCLPDGREMEVVMRGLRNPQEIAFDQFGNLFAADNNCDKGDHSRLVYVMDGANSGWNMAFQSLAEPYLTGPWHAERMWHLKDSPASQTGDRPAWLLPPVGKLGAGPSGFTYYPGTGLPSGYDHHFFLCNFTGNGGIETFTLLPDGAGFQQANERDFMKPALASDCEFGYDGKLYVSDFVGLIWTGGTTGGRIFTVTDAASQADPVVSETSQLVRDGIRNLTSEKLQSLLAHRDMRVRQRAQFALAARGSEARSHFVLAADVSNPTLQRLHAVWGLSQMAAEERRASRAAQAANIATAYEAFVAPVDESLQSADEILKLAGDKDPEVRAQVCRVLGDLRYRPAASFFEQSLEDESARVRMFAALAIGRIRPSTVSAAVIKLIESNAGADPCLQHATVMSLAGTVDFQNLRSYAAHANVSVRLSVLLAVRLKILEQQQQWNFEESDTIPSLTLAGEYQTLIAEFLRDNDLRIVTEAARMINDLPLETLTSDLAQLAEGLKSTDQTSQPEALLRRVLNANFREGQTSNLQHVVNAAADEKLSAVLRQEAFQMLLDWEQPAQRDRVTGFWRPVNARAPETLIACRKLLAEQIAELMAVTPDQLQETLVQLIDLYDLPTDLKVFAGWIGDSGQPVSSRVAALRYLARQQSGLVEISLQQALNSDQPLLRAEARDVAAQLNPSEAAEVYINVAENAQSSILERQRALLGLAKVDVSAADAAIVELATKLAEGKLEPALQLDMIEAGTLNGSAEVAELINRFKQQQSDGGLLSQHLVSLEGGDAERGRSLFVGHRVAQCVRCHKAGTLIPGGNAGPDLAQVARRHPRLALLQSLVEPSALIARGFESVTLVLDSGNIVAGVIRSEADGMVTIEQPDGRIVTVKTEEIEERTPARSAMPEMHRTLTPREMRDLVEFLSTLQ